MTKNRIITAGVAMSSVDIRRAEDFLNTLVGSACVSSESNEYQSRLVFEKKLEFVVSSPWRVLLKGTPIAGSGDIGDIKGKNMLDSIKGLRVTAASVSSSWDTRLVLENNYIFEVIPDSVQYETWEAHLEAGWVIFAGGEVTLFPPATRADDSHSTKV
jgi:hypothetical protein